MPTIVLVLEIAALVFGIVAVVNANGKEWAGWGVICLAVALLIGHIG